MKLFKKHPRLEEFIKNETTALKQVNNINVIKCYNNIKTVNNCYLVYEFCNGGTLDDLIYDKNCLTEKDALNFFRQIINGMKGLVDNRILHRDLKPANILLHNGIIKIADFGFCQSVNDIYQMTGTMIGSPVYMAPELLNGFDYNTKADIWSMGVMLYEMLFGYPPYAAAHIGKIIDMIYGQPLDFSKEVNPTVTEKTKILIKKLLKTNLHGRIDWPELFTYDFSW